MHITWPDLSKIIAELVTESAALPETMSRVLYRGGEKIMAEAKQMTPVDTGALRASGHVTPPVVVSDHIEVGLAFGGPSAPYALYVHEDLEAHHVVGGAKYLEIPVNRNAQSIESELALALALLGKG